MFLKYKFDTEFFYSLYIKSISKPWQRKKKPQNRKKKKSRGFGVFKETTNQEITKNAGRDQMGLEDIALGVHNLLEVTKEKYFTTVFR